MLCEAVVKRFGLGSNLVKIFKGSIETSSRWVSGLSGWGPAGRHGRLWQTTALPRLHRLPQRRDGARGSKRMTGSHSLSFNPQQEEVQEELNNIPGRMFQNGSSNVASLFTMQGKKGTNQDAMIVWETNDELSNQRASQKMQGGGGWSNEVQARYHHKCSSAQRYSYLCLNGRSLWFNLRRCGSCWDRRWLMHVVLRGLQKRAML